MKLILLSLSIILLLTGCKANVEEPEQISGDDIVPFSASQIDAHNSRISLDWEGSYSGVLPCEDCIGIDTFLKINRDHSYTAVQRFVDSNDVATNELQSEGTFFWNDDGSSITLESIHGDISTFRVGELFLTPLTRNGMEVRPEPGNNFKLLKQ